jgi:hypothetical protein
MNKKITTFAAMTVAAGSVAFANIPLIEYPEFSSYDGWTFGANRFQPKTTWLEFVSAPDAFEYTDRVQPSGDGFIFYSWDDEIADRIETYIFNEHKAGPPTGAWANDLFEAGDVIVFKGSASATRSGENTDDMIVRAFIKTLGFGRWEFDTLVEYTAFHDVGPDLEPFELTVTFPDYAEDDRAQVLQVGFEITTEYDGTAMDSGTIYFENIEAYIQRDAEPTLWNGFEVDAEGYVHTGEWMGIINVELDPWVYVYDLQQWVFLPQGQDMAGGGWINLMK